MKPPPEITEILDALDWMAEAYPDDFVSKIDVKKIFIFPVCDSFLFKFVVRANPEAVSTCPAVAVSYCFTGQGRASTKILF